MTNTRKDFQTDRNQRIYNDYLSGKYSYSLLASKYKITSQRAQSIVKDFQARGYGKTLAENSPISEREEFKNEAVKIRENGNLIIAENMFNQIIVWDLKNNNPKGAIDAYGGLRIVYSRIGKGKRTDSEKLKYFKKAEDTIKSAIDLSHKFPETREKGRLAMLNTHYAGSSLDMVSLINDPHIQKQKLQETLKIIGDAIKDLPGSRAHLSWPKRIKGEILFKLGNTEEALDTLLTAEKDIFLGYEDEIKGDKDKEFVIAIWLAGLHLTIARIAKEMNLPVLAKHYAVSVICTDIKHSTLNERKKEAKSILNSLKES